LNRDALREGRSGGRRGDFLPHNSTAYQQPSVALICIFALTLSGLRAAQPSVITSAPRWIRISFVQDGILEHPAGSLAETSCGH
jgi:hypothetical protein